MYTQQLICIDGVPCAVKGYVSVRSGGKAGQQVNYKGIADDAEIDLLL